MIISRLQIAGLYDLYNYDINLNKEDGNQITILTGPNGYGKTTLLLSISHLYKGNFWYFHFLAVTLELETTR